ncbi:hypothetical protein [Seonamhaeicola aphaedonensis]|uniref:Antitoxin Xre/MbcA/ParS-like toxin-binding domain-containing protein n=1 Tax=Seonamhaeicola aphaedonensis TaxID=1461338 RepID=A0A3D9H7Z9_9FLAO|nr:hypothetical protein [Seonamhaeicola aphaedonensis]RED45625.1 hypothetical protein DFQ02_1082 [Seonamhaeicola aphaedonensis]
MLEKFYKGDDSWEKFVSVFPKHSSLQCNVDYSQLYNNLNKNEDLSIVIYELLGAENSLKWINENSPALNGLRPVDCLEGNLLNRLKVMLMRF